MSKFNFTGARAIKQGATFVCTFRWESAVWSYKAISAISKAAPARITTTTPHGIPDGWGAWVVGCKGMTQINGELDDTTQLPKETSRHKVTLIDTTNVDLNDVNSTNFGTYTTGGVLAWKTPNDLAGFSARMQFRDSIEATDILLELTTNPAPGGGAGNARLVVNNVTKTITATLTATETAAITWEKAVYDLELVSGAGTVTRISEGAGALSKEVTR